MLESLLNKVKGLQNKETPTQVFSCEYCEIFKNTYFEEHLQTAASKGSIKNNSSVLIPLRVT